MNKPYCTCIFDGTWHRNDGWEPRAYGTLWVHYRCGKPSKMVYEKVLIRDLIRVNERELDWESDIIEEFYYSLGEEEEAYA